VSADHVQAIVDRLTGAKLRVFDADPSSPTYPYVVVYADAGTRFSDRESDQRVSREIGWQTTVVGSSVAQCRAALDRVTGALEDWRPIVPTRSCSKVEHEGTQPVRPDESAPDRSLFIATDQWRFSSDPA
jgi:hypothetical protein